MSRIANLLKNTSMVKYIRYTKAELDGINQRLDDIEKYNKEILFANIFHDSIQDSYWVKNKGFSAYGAAANYSLLYKQFKIYEVLKPKNILEFGLGQTTKLTYQYVEANRGVKAFVVDDDQKWIDAYQDQITIPTGMNIVKRDLQDFKYGGKVLQKKSEYKGIKDLIKNIKFNFILVDGPIGWDKIYSRPNIVSLVGSLARDWIVVFDDAEREGEQRTMELFREQLVKNDIKYEEFDVQGYKKQHFFCAPHLYNIAMNI